MNHNSFGSKLKYYRKNMKLTQTDFGKMLNVSQVTIANYERGERFPKQDMLITISRIFDVSVDALLENNRKDKYFQTYPEGFSFTIDALLKLLLSSPIQEALSYTAGWKSSAHFTLTDLYEKVFTPVLIKTGEMWTKGEILVSEEHLITDKMRELILLHANREMEKNSVKTVENKRWMGFCAPGESHDLALLMTAQSLKLLGWQVYYLGVQVPFKDLSGIIKKYKPDILGISITMPFNVEGLEMYLSSIRAEFGRYPAVILGGRGLSHDKIKDFACIDGFAASISEGLKLAEELVNRE